MRAGLATMHRMPTLPPQRSTLDDGWRWLERLAVVPSFVERHLAEPLDGARLAAQVALSRYHFQRVFGACFGITVAGYVTWRRLHRACGLLAAGRMSVLEAALEVGYETPQALAKAMRREIGTTPGAVRNGERPSWQRLFARRAGSPPAAGEPAVRWAELPERLLLTATGHGIAAGSMAAAAREALHEIRPVLAAAAGAARVTGYVGIVPDRPQRPDDARARLLLGALLDGGRSADPGAPPAAIALSGTLAWRRQPAGRHAVFTHVGRDEALHGWWTAIHERWLPATGYQRSDEPSFEHYVAGPAGLARGERRTDIYVPLR